MANNIYPLWKQELLKATAAASLNGTGATGVYAALIDTGTGVAYNAAHQFYSSIASGQVGTEVELTAKTFANGLFDAADTVISNVSGVTAEAIAIFIKTAGANTTWTLVAWIDTGVTGLPVTPNSGSINMTWSPSGIFQL